MIHIMRKDETVEDIAGIYGISTEDILKENRCAFGENCAVYIPSGCEIFFTEKECTVNELSLLTSQDEESLIRENHLKKGCIIPPNTRIRGRKKNYDRKMFSCIYSPVDISSDFVNIDRKAFLYSRIFVDCYEVISGELSLPKDYPAVNACRINGITPGIFIGNTSLFSDEDIFSQLRQDMKYKDYAEVLIHIKDPSEEGELKYLTECFVNMGMKVSIIGSEAVLKDAEYENYDTLYYSSRKNIFDFGSFVNIISSLLENIPERYLGYDLKLCAADIERSSMKIRYPDINGINELLRGKDSLSYDSDSKLCFFRSEDKNHNYIFEDLRTIYAKCAYLREKGISKFINRGIDESLLRCAYDGYEK